MAGGYGFWCSGDCARKKDEEKKRQEDAINMALAGLNKEGPNIVMLALGGLIITGGLLVLYYKYRKK